MNGKHIWDKNNEAALLVIEAILSTGIYLGFLHFIFPILGPLLRLGGASLPDIVDLTWETNAFLARHIYLIVLGVVAIVVLAVKFKMKRQARVMINALFAMALFLSMSLIGGTALGMLERAKSGGLYLTWKQDVK